MLVMANRTPSLQHSALAPHVPFLFCVMQLDIDDEPVWRQVLRLHLKHSDPTIAQQAAAALGE
jgi:hypothetical protein